MAAKLSPLTKVAKLDAEISALRERLDAKLNDRQALLSLAIAQGEQTRGEIRSDVQSLSQATHFVQHGRIFTDEQVREIRTLNASGVSQCELARRYGLSQPTIYRIVHRLSYKDVA